MATSKIQSMMNTAWVDVKNNIVNNYIVTTSSSRVQYRVRNDICFVRLNNVSFANVPSIDTTILTGLPRPSGGVNLSTRILSNANVGHSLSISTSDNATEGWLLTNPSTDTTGKIYETFSYPVGTA